jgi:DNA ligase (NAD+)
MPKERRTRKKRGILQFNQWKINEKDEIEKQYRPQLSKKETIKRKLIIESSSSSNSSPKTLKIKNKIKTPLIIESSSESERKEKEKDKIEHFFHEKNGTNQMNLKISQEKELSKMMTPRMNEKYIELMEKLADIMLKQGEPFRARAYQKALETIMAYPDDILSPNDLKGKPGIGTTIMEKLNEFTLTGTLKVIEREKDNPVNILGEVYGIGPKKAKELVESGIHSIEQLRENQDKYLNETQKIGLKYYEDIQKRIPRSEIEEYKDIFEKAFPKDSDAKMEIVGSYRRGNQSSGDIDVIITSKSPSIFTTFIDNLIKEKIILHVLSRGPTKCLVITKYALDPARRVDFLYTSPEEFPFAILYFTGSKIFNTVMRHHALTMGFTMNEHGLYNMEAKKKGDKVDHIFKDERDIFDYLNLEYKAPNERTDGRAVVIKKELKPSMNIKYDLKELEAKPNLKKIEDKVDEKKVDEKVEDKDEKNKKKSSTLKKKDMNIKKKSIKEKKVLKIESDSEDEKELKQTVINVNIKNIIDDFKHNGIKVLENLNENQLSSMLREANKAYYNEQPILNDNEYDIVKEYIENKYPSNKIIEEIGAPVERNKANLPYEMASMNKIKPDTSALENWIKKYKGPYVISCKLDGVSGLYTTEGNTPKLYTRGDGKVGQDVSHLIPYLRLPKTKNIVIRGEFIIPKKIFDEKYKTKFANPRNMVAGIVNHKSINETIKDLHFVAYELISPIKKPSEQLDFISTLDVEIVLFEVKNMISNEILSETLVDWRQNYIYEIDGVIVTDDKIHERKTGNPDYAFAFKMVLSEQIAEAKVVDVLWTPSKDGYLKPRVQIEPIHLGGVKIEFATGNNAAFIENNKIGVGAVIEIIRSGDVIPKIVKVSTPAEIIRMPTVPYKWNNTHVDIMLEDIGLDETVKEKNITGFFRGIGVEGLSSGNISRIIQSGYDSVPKIIKMTIEDLLKVEGFKIKTAQKIHDGIKNKLDEASLVTIMSATNLFGRGFSEKKIELIMDTYPDILLSNESTVEKIKRISSIKGMAEKSAEAFVENIQSFIKFMEEAELTYKLNNGSKKENEEESKDVKGDKKEVDQSHQLFGKTIIMTGFRDKELENKLKNIGVKVGSSVSKNTYLVLVKDKDEDTGKANEARKLNIPLVTPLEFKNKFNL